MLVRSLERSKALSTQLTESSAIHDVVKVPIRYSTYGRRPLVTSDDSIVTSGQPRHFVKVLDTLLVVITEIDGCCTSSACNSKQKDIH